MLVFTEIALVACAALCSTAIALWWLKAPNPHNPDKRANVGDDAVSLLFEDGILHHATPLACSTLALEPGVHTWQDLQQTLLRKFPDFPEHQHSGETGHVCLRAFGGVGSQQVDVRWRNNLCWVTLGSYDQSKGPSVDADLLVEITALRHMSQTAPYPVWQEDKSGQVVWHNDAYASLFRLAFGSAVDANKRLFTQADDLHPTRVTLQASAQDKPDWYELTSVNTQDVTVFHANCINAVVEAEQAQRNFVQTLAKTFAHLSIGLAIFDRKGQLALFNPALVDLTDLPAQFLSARPTMLSFLDQLRETRRMPEPKNYRSWRQEIADVIAAATDGRYKETWSLETGQTYSVKGRPHPDGATAFIIEDISAEVTLTRNFRAELEQAQILIDAVDDAMAFFSSTGILTFSNAAYRALWQVDPDAAFADVSVQDCLRSWQEKCIDKDAATTICAQVGQTGTRTPARVKMSLRNGRTLSCQINPIPTGATLIRFHETEHRVPALVKEPAQTVG